MLLHALSLSVALVPGFHRWWNGRMLRDAGNDPALAERWLALRTRSTYVSFVAAGIAAGIAATLGTAAVAVVVAVLMVGSAIGGFPARRAVFNESWSIGNYLFWWARFTAGFWGFWIALCAVPAIVPADVRWAGAVAALLLLLWYYWYGALLRWSVGATRFDPGAVSPELAAGFARVLDGSTAPRPHLWRAGPPESMIANAVALPAIRTSSVMFSNALLESLNAAEIAAILAHEMGHLEHYTRRRLLWMSVGSLPLVGFATLVLPQVSRGERYPLTLLWPLFVLVTLVLRMRSRQKHETTSDRRAVELCGDAEALATGLTKVHALGRIPRRFSSSMEQRATHPSLARRLAAIRGMAGRPAAIDVPLVFQGADGTSWIVMGSDRLRFITGVPEGTAPDTAALVAGSSSAIALTYSEIGELRIVADTSGTTRLTAVNKHAMVWSMVLRADSVGAVQAALDRVDHLITPATPREATAYVVSVSLSAGVAVAGLLSHSPTLVALGAMTALTPSPGACLATGLGAVIVGVVSLHEASWIRDAEILSPLVLALGLGAIATAWRWRPTSLPSHRALLPAMLAVATAIAWIAAAFIASNLLAFHRLAATNPAGIVGPAALGGALWCLYPQRRRLAASAWVLGLVAAVIASPIFVRVVVRDPLIATMGTFTQRTASLTPIAKGPAPDHATALRVSPDGRHFIAGIDENDEDEPSGTYVVGAVGESGRPVKALDAQFLDDRRVLILSEHETGASLGLYVLPELDEAAWAVMLGTRSASRLLVDQRSGRWRVIGYTRKEVIRVDGDADGTFTEDRWAVSPADARLWIVGNGPDLLDLKSRANYGWSQRLQVLYTRDLHIPLYPQSLGVMDGHGVRSIADSDQNVRCQSPIPGHTMVCFASDGGTTRVWHVDGDRLLPVGTMTGEIMLMDTTPDGELTAWRNNERLLVDTEGLVLLSMRRTAGEYAYEYWSEWTAAGTTVGALVSDDEDRVWIRTFARR